MKLIQMGLSILLAVLISSCSTHFGSMSTPLLDEDYVYEDIAFGVSQTNHFFGIGGLSKDAVVLEAKRQLFLNRPLSKNESYANFRV